MLSRSYIFLVSSTGLGLYTPDRYRVGRGKIVLQSSRQILHVHYAGVVADGVPDRFLADSRPRLALLPAVLACPAGARQDPKLHHRQRCGGQTPRPRRQVLGGKWPISEKSFCQNLYPLSFSCSPELVLGVGLLLQYM